MKCGRGRRANLAVAILESNDGRKGLDTPNFWGQLSVVECGIVVKTIFNGCSKPRSIHLPPLDLKLQGGLFRDDVVLANSAFSSLFASMKRVISSLILSLGFYGCAHEVAFQDAHYDIGGTRDPHRVAVVIDNQTLASKEVINSGMAGVVNDWEVQPGEMLKQVSDIEFPQMFESYTLLTSYPAEFSDTARVIVELSIVQYDFSDFHAKITTRVVISKMEPGKRVLLDRTYQGTGASQGGKMFWGGAFSMKSAIRQSSIDAYKKIFRQIREDLIRSL